MEIEKTILRPVSTKDRLPDKEGDYLLIIQETGSLPKKINGWFCIEGGNKMFGIPGKINITHVVSHWYEEMSVGDFETARYKDGYDQGYYDGKNEHLLDKEDSF